MIARLELKNFTAFQDLAIDFSSKVNVIIGENGTGKTHLLKAAYGMHAGAPFYRENPKATDAQVRTVITRKFLRLFMPMEEKLSKLRRNESKGKTSVSTVFADHESITATFQAHSRELAIKQSRHFDRLHPEALFLPTKEVLSLVRGMTADDCDQATVERIFDAGYVDLAKALIREQRDDLEESINRHPRLGHLIPELTKLIGGRYRRSDGAFCFESGRFEEAAHPDRSRAQHARMYQDSTVERFVPSRGPSFPSAMTAEGFRKIGILQQLLSNGTLGAGSRGPLFWDEPESNLNPRLMKVLVQAILDLSRNGQQVIVATHDYVLLKWFDLLAEKGKEDHILFHALWRSHETNEIHVETTDSFNLVSKSAISDTFAELYDEDVKRALGE